MTITSSLASSTTPESAESAESLKTKRLTDTIAGPAAKALYAIYCPIKEITGDDPPPSSEEAEDKLRAGVAGEQFVVIGGALVRLFTVENFLRDLKLEWRSNAPVAIATVLQSSEPVILKGLGLLAHFIAGQKL